MNKKQIILFYYKLAEQQQAEIIDVEKQIESIKKNA